MNNLTLALDAMGGDNSPQVIIQSALQAIETHPDLNIFLVGHSEQLTHHLKNKNIHPSRLQVVHAEQIVDMGTLPLTAVRKYTNSSMRVALDLVQSGQADACVSAGNTGALMAMSKIVLQTLPNIDRPALITALPTVQKNKTYLLDIGANVACSAETLYQFALMGTFYAQTMSSLEKPKVALLNIGIENIKGNSQIQEAADYLQTCPMIHYVGFIEGDRLFSGDVDVIVCDGFVGNIALKTAEGLAKFIFGKSEVSFLHRMLRPFMSSSYGHMDPKQYNGASFLGLQKVVVKSHGNADVETFYHAIENCMLEVQRKSPVKIQQKIQSVLI